MTQQSYAYMKKWRYDRDRGIKRFVDPGPARSHVIALHAAGFSWSAIADAAGVSKHGVIRLTRDPKHIRLTTEAAILRVKAEDVFARTTVNDFVPGAGARRRVQALMAIGHTAATIVAAMGPGTPPATASNLIHKPGEWISRANHDRARRAYDALWDTPGASPRTRTVAARHGYLPPLAWDDESIDDPAATPAPLTEKRPGGKALFVEDIEFLLEHEPLATAQQLADRLHVTRDAIQVACRRADRPDLIDRLNRNVSLTAAA